jgi:signal transduction histidine kinase/ActR/RegA family two-component response regulator
VLPRRIGLRWIVVALTLSVVAPLGFVSVVSMQRTSRRILTTVDRQNLATVHAISVGIDGEIETTMAALDVFGTLHALDAPDAAAFRSLAARLIVKQPDWSAIQLADLNGRLLDVWPASASVNPQIVEQWARKVGTTGQPVVSSLFEVPNLPGHFLTIAVPIVRDGRVTLALGAQVKPDAFTAILRKQRAPLNGVVSLLDASNRVVARSKDHDAYVGMTATVAFAEMSSRAAEGSWQTTNRDGVPVYSAYSRSPLTGMTVGLAVPKQEVDGPVRRIMWLLGGAWVAILALGASMAIVFGRVIVRAMRSASSAAMALAHGEPVAPMRSRIAEIDDLATGLRDASVTLQTRNLERDEASRLKDEFLMTVSHELRTPLTAIYGWARMLKSGQVRASQQEHAIEAIERNANALTELVNDLLDVSRIVSGKLRLDVQRVAVAEVIGAAVDAIRPAAVAKKIAVAINAGDPDAVVSGDPRRLQQIVWNLLSNAVRFTPGGGRIDVEVARRADLVTIAVRDTGPGIDAAFLPHVFERFRQGVSGTTRQHGGLGLGLAIVRHLVELHGGTVRVENNTAGPGAAFYVVLPAQTAVGDEATSGYPRAAAPAPQTIARLDGLAALVTDDDMNAREMLVEMLEAAGAEVRTAASAEDALIILDGWTPDVLVSDIEMPGEDGYALIGKVRALVGTGSRIRAIALTAHARPEDRVKALDAGFQWHLAKPVEPGELVSVIATLVAQSSSALH